MSPRNIEKLLGRKPRKTVMWIQDHLPDARLPFKLGVARRAPPIGAGLASPLWTTFIAAAGAGAAFWWWTQWARGRAEAEARENQAIADGAAHPETVMAHAPKPPSAGAAPIDGSDAELVEPAEDLMAHRPPGAATSPLTAEAKTAADESLGVQGTSSDAKAPRRRKPAAAPVVTH